MYIFSIARAAGGMGEKYKLYLFVHERYNVGVGQTGKQFVEPASQRTAQFENK